MKQRATYFTLLLSLLVVFPACSSFRAHVAPEHSGWENTALPPASDLSYRVFLIGDTGSPRLDVQEPTLKLLQARLDAAGEESAVVFLGDNIYCCGLPDSADQGRARAESRIMEALKAVENYPGRVFFIPGNHDWDHLGSSDRLAVQREEAFIEAYLDRGNVFIPDDGFPGPHSVKLTDDIRLLALDTQWWLTDPDDKPYGDTGDYDLDEDADMLLEMDDQIRRHDDEHLLVVGHHPMMSNGEHAGFFPLRTHLFPLTEIWKNAYVPLPILGSLVPLYVRYIGTRQDLANARYRSLRRGLQRIFSGHESLIYASGHDHTLQLFETPGEPSQHYIVSGSGSKRSGTAQGRGETFAYGAQGFMTLYYYRDGSVWLEAWTPDGDGSTGTLRFRTELEGTRREAVDPELPTAAAATYPDYSDSTFVIAANPGYLAGPIKTFFWGSHNRDVWAIPVQVPYLDLGREAGGLTPVKRGGGQQTFSLRLEGADGTEYVLRSVDKDPSVSVPENLRGTIVTEIVQDQIASINPYGAYIVPKLATAAGVMHTSPRLVYVPHDPRLGVYADQFGGQLMMFEERPNGKMRGWPVYKNPDDIISPASLYKEIDDDNDHRVDQRAFVRARLFDMLLSDWDRHRNQWRWAAFEPPDKEGKIYRPVPRDRDWAFNRFNGFFPFLTKTAFDPKFQQFSHNYGYIKGLTTNGLEQDRRFTDELDREAWVSIADSLSRALTDEVIEQAVHDLPAAVFDYQGQELIDLLKERRGKLRQAAEEYYGILARVVDLVASNKHERFEVNRLDDDRTEVILYKTNKEGEIRKELYRRTFLNGETREIRLFGRDGNDTFVLKGDVHRGILIRIIGGAGDDTYQDDSHVDGLRHKTKIYDTVTGNEWAVDQETETVLSNDPSIHTYDPLAYKHNVSSPQVFFGSNPDDGVFIGGGMKFVRHGFRHAPFAATHRIVGNIATKTRAFNVVYEGYFDRFMGNMDLAFDAEWLSPDNIRNFYGLGNETENTVEDRKFYQARLTQINVSAILHRDYDLGASFYIGPRLTVTDVQKDEDRFVSPEGELQEGISANTFDTQPYGGLKAGMVLSTLDNALNPRQGFRLEGSADANIGLRSDIQNYLTLASDLALYFSPSLHPQFTFASRAGVAHNVGDFPFFAANTLGGKSNLRGWRSTRFAGRTSFYQNVELRTKLANFSTYVAIGELGVLGFFDNGRVWTDGEKSKAWHQGYGGGLWMLLFDAFSLTGTVGFSEEETTVTVKFGFQY